MQLETEKNIKDSQTTFESKFAGCECCKGYIYNCKAEMCHNMGVCYCVMREEMETTV